MIVLASRRHRHRRNLVVGSVAVFLVFTLLSSPDDRWSTAINDLAQLAVAGLAAVATAIAGRQAPTRTLRRSWWGIAAGCAAWAAGQLVWTVYEVLLERAVPFPSLADAGFLLFVPLTFLGILPLVDSPAAHLSRIRAGLEAVMIAGGLLFVSWVTVLRPLAEDATGTALARVLGLAYPLGDILVLSVAVFAATRRAAHRSNALGLLAIGIAAISISDSAFLYLTQTDTYSGTEWLDTGWFAGFLLVALAAAKPPPTRTRPTTSTRTIALLAIPFVPIAAAAIVAAVMATRGEPIDVVSTYVAVVVIMVLVIHQMWVALENHTITGSLAQRIDERTTELATTLRYFRQVVEKSTDVIIVLDAALTVRDVAASVEHVFGIAPQDVRSRPIAHVFPDDESAELHAGIGRAMGLPEGTSTVVWTLVDRDGRRRHAQTAITNLLEDPAVLGIVLNSRDITDQRELEEALRHQAFHDSLTNLPNRALFTDRAEHALLRSTRHGTAVAALLIDLDDFKTVNDSLGHNSGDELLAIVAQRLRRNLRPVDTIARLGGDEFVVLLEDVEGPHEADETATRLLQAIRSPMHVAGRELNCAASIGVAVSDSTCLSVEQLLRNADTAMYVSKREGRGRTTTFVGEMHERARQRLELQAELGRAITGGELVLQYQPSIDLDTQHLDGFEALVRWAHPVRGMLGPGAFIPLAEESGLIIALGRWVLAEACRTAARWVATNDVDAEFALAVNVSARQLEYGGLVDDVRNALITAGLAPQRLVLEITESVLVDDSRTVVEQLQELKQLGVRIAIDDFGTGYASLAYLRQLPIDILKIDKTFVDEAASGPDGSRFLRAILNLGTTLKLRTIAEGIEQPDQLETLRASGCVIGQGFLFSRPLDEPAAAAFLADRTMAPRP